MTLLVVFTLLSAAAAGQTYELAIRAEQGIETTAVLCAQLADIQLSGMSMGVSGNGQATIKARVNERTDTGLLKLEVTLSDLRAYFNGAEQEPRTPDPLTVTIDDHGRLAQVEGVEETQALDIMSMGGAPMQVLALATIAPRLPQQPVHVGDPWQVEEEQPTPFGVSAKVKWCGELLSVEEDKARIRYTGQAELQPFKAANPMQPGTELNVKKSIVKLQDLIQVVDLKTGLVVESHGRLHMLLDVEIPEWGQEMPVAIDVDFASAPEEQRARELLGKVAVGTGEQQQAEQEQAAQPERNEQPAAENEDEQEGQ